MSKVFSIKAIVSYESNKTNVRKRQIGCVFNTHDIVFLCVFKHFNRVKDADTQLIWGTENWLTDMIFWIIVKVRTADIHIWGERET